jgi:hypothetical protein
MDIVIDISGKIVVDNMGDIGNIQTTCSNSSRDQNGETSRAEHLKGTLTLTLSTISMDGSGWEVLIN